MSGRSQPMPALPDLQAAFSEAIRSGPDHVPFDAFEAGDRRVMLGFAVYANNISYARLTSLEQTFPRTMEYIGEDAFNRLSRNFVESGKGSAASLNDIGATFAEWLELQGEQEAALFARFEWYWLQSYRAAEGVALSRNDLATLDEAGLLAMQLVRHPAARLSPACESLCEAVGLPEPSEAILIARPEADVLIHGMTPEAEACFALLEHATSVENVLNALSQEFDEAAILPSILHLIDAGALMRT